MSTDTPDHKAQLRLPNRHRYTQAEFQADSIGFIIFLVIGIPLLEGLAIMPFWDQIGDWRIIAAIDAILAPAIGKLPHIHQWGLTHRRLLVGASTILYALFIFQFLIVVASKKRRFLLLELYDLYKRPFCLMLAAYWILLGYLWYLFFVNEAPPTNMYAGKGIFLVPLFVVILGQMTTIAFVGAFRDVAYLMRRLLVRCKRLLT